jgi:hypothetical protein
MPSSNRFYFEVMPSSNRFYFWSWSNFACSHLRRFSAFCVFPSPATQYVIISDSPVEHRSQLTQTMVRRQSPASVRKGRLTATDAARIFKAKLKRTSRTSAQLAEEYGVTSKAIRDVWSLKTWVVFTRPYWTEEDKSQFGVHGGETPLTDVQSAEQAFATECRQTYARSIFRSMPAPLAPTQCGDHKGDRAIVTTTGASIDAELVKLPLLQSDTAEVHRG